MKYLKIKSFRHKETGVIYKIDKQGRYPYPYKAGEPVYADHMAQYDLLGAMKDPKLEIHRIKLLLNGTNSKQQRSDNVHDAQ